jgi:hypothetical protein
MGAERHDDSRDGWVAPYYSLSRRAWIPCVVRWDAESGEFTRAEGPDGFATWREAEEASRFLARSADASRA